eukprot:gene16991-12160_t
MSGDSKAAQWKFPTFPASLVYIHNAKQEVPLYQVERLRYHYNLATTSSCPMIIQQMSRAMYQIYRKERINLPVGILDQFCKFCHCFLVPGVTCTQRLRPRSGRSKVNQQSKPHVKNELIFNCLRCNRKGRTVKGHACKVRESKKPKEEVIAGSSSSESKNNNSSKAAPKSSGASQQLSKAGVAVAPPQQKFSFLSNMKPGASSSTMPAKPGSSFSFLKNQQQSGGKGLSGDFIPLGGSSLKPSSSNSSSKPGQPNLMDIERQKKLEKRRKSLGL